MRADKGIPAVHATVSIIWIGLMIWALVALIKSIGWLWGILATIGIGVITNYICGFIVIGISYLLYKNELDISPQNRSDKDFIDMDNNDDDFK